MTILELVARRCRVFLFICIARKNGFWRTLLTPWRPWRVTPTHPTPNASACDLLVCRRDKWTKLSTGYRLCGVPAGYPAVANPRDHIFMLYVMYQLILINLINYILYQFYRPFWRLPLSAFWGYRKRDKPAVDRPDEISGIFSWLCRLAGLDKCIQMCIQPRDNSGEISPSTSCSDPLDHQSYWACTYTPLVCSLWPISI